MTYRDKTRECIKNVHARRTVRLLKSFGNDSVGSREILSYTSCDVLQGLFFIIIYAATRHGINKRGGVICVNERGSNAFVTKYENNRFQNNNTHT